MPATLSTAGFRTQQMPRASLLARILRSLGDRRSVRRLRELDDRMLRDIGLTRYDLSGIDPVQHWF